LGHRIVRGGQPTRSCAVGHALRVKIATHTPQSATSGTSTKPSACRLWLQLSPAFCRSSRRIYELIETHAKSLGRVEFVTRQRYALFRSVRIFADLTVMTTCVRLVVHLHRRVDDPAFYKVVTGEKAVSHVVQLTTPAQWKEVKAYFAEAYRASLS
jgi:hypothetical protein